MAFGKLQLRLTIAGLDACEADPQWVMQKSGEELTDTLNAALADAKAALANAAQAAPAARLTGLLDEMLAAAGAQADLAGRSDR